VALGEVFIILGNSDDYAGGVVIGIAIILASIAVATTMAVLERAVQSTVDKAGITKKDLSITP
jgi:hypothetical protein